jgi:hypothetical protein
MRQKVSIELFQYWDRLRDGRPAPKRTEIEPADIKSLLADTFILQKGALGDAVFRLAGTTLCAAFGRELKGTEFSSLWMQHDKRIVARLADGAFLTKSVVLINFEGVSCDGRSNMFELLLLPLDGGVEHPQSLGSITPLEHPFWLGADPIAECRIASLRVIDPDREPPFLNQLPQVGVPSLSPSLDDCELIERAGSGRRIGHPVVLDGGRTQ